MSYLDLQLHAKNMSIYRRPVCFTFALGKMMPQSTPVGEKGLRSDHPAGLSERSRRAGTIDIDFLQWTIVFCIADATTLSSLPMLLSRSCHPDDKGDLTSDGSSQRRHTAQMATAYAS